MDHEKMRIQGGVSVIQYKISLPVKKKNQIISKEIQKETLPCIRMEGSYMAELAVAIPFFVGFLMIILFFFQILTVEQEVENALFSTGRELAVVFCEKQEDTAGERLTAKALFLKNLAKNSAAEEFVTGGRMGISLSESDFSGNYVRLKANYKICFPIGLFGKKELRITQKVMCRKWTGRNDSDPKEEIVYVAKNGSVYHRSRECTYLKPSVESVNKNAVGGLRNADGGKYYSCGACIKGNMTNTMVVYITKYGNRYHGRRDCKRIKRTVFAVRLSETEGKNACSKCGKE